MVDVSSAKPLSITEGQFLKGCLNGYARKLDALGECQVGYWKPLDLSSSDETGAVVTTSQVSVPWGKWAWYTSSGLFKCKEDYYIGQQDGSSIEIIQITPESQAKELKKRAKMDVVLDYKSNLNMSEPFIIPPARKSGFLGCCGGPVEKVRLNFL